MLELGAGSSGYAAIASLLAYQPETVVITDGKAVNLTNIGKTLSTNGWEAKPVILEELLWGETAVKQKYELILAADCLFFEKYH